MGVIIQIKEIPGIGTKNWGAGQENSQHPPPGQEAWGRASPGSYSIKVCV